MRRLMRAAGLAAILLAASAATAAAAPWHDWRNGTTLAVIGDTPYGAEQVAGFPADIAEINADPSVRRVIHLGDIKNGSSRCDDAYLAARRADFDTFEDPLVYTPGDNEWTDCHRANNGAYLPTERLAKLRELFFAEPGRTLGGRDRVAYQSQAFPENVLWAESRVVFGAVHLVGSNDGQAPWFGDRATPETPAETALRVGEYTARERAAQEWIDATFAAARAARARGVVLAMQADMWDASAPPSSLTAFTPFKAQIAARAAEFGRPVLLLQGDSHSFLVDRPAGMPANVTRVVVQGSTNLPREWLRLRVAPKTARVFSCENVLLRSGAAVPCPAPLTP